LPVDLVVVEVHHQLVTLVLLNLLLDDVHVGDGSLELDLVDEGLLRDPPEWVLHRRFVQAVVLLRRHCEEEWSYALGHLLSVYDPRHGCWRR